MAIIELNDFIRLENAFTKNCIQYGWGAKYYFPCCPAELESNFIEAYIKNLYLGAVFAWNDDSPKLILYKFVIEKKHPKILVMCEREGVTCEREGFHPWLIAEVITKNDLFIHSHLGTYFEQEDAERELIKANQQ